MPKAKSEVESSVNKDVLKMLKETGFTETTLPKSMQEKYKGHKATYAVKVTAKDGKQTHLMVIAIFDDSYSFAILDDCGIIKMCSFKPDTPANVLYRYISALAYVLKI